MKICFISTMSGSLWGGSEELWYRTAIAAHDSGHTVEVVLFKKEVVHKKIAYLNSLNIPVHFIENIKQIIPNILFRVFNKILKIPTKVKYTNRWDFLSERNIKSILISQGSSLDSIYIPDLREFLQKTHIPFNFLIQHNVEYGFIDEKTQTQAINIFNKAQKIFFVAERNLKVLQRQLVCNISNAYLVQNPVNRRSVTPLKWPTGEVVKFAVIARLEIDYKGQDLLLEAFSHLQWQQRRFQVNLFGEGPSKEYLEKLIKFYNLTDKIFLKGHIENIQKIWEEHHLLILPSHSEGTPLALLEAMSCGRSAIVTDVGDNAKWIKNGFNGYVVPCASANSLDKVLEKAWSEKKEWGKMGKLSSDEIQEKFIENPEQLLLAHILNENPLNSI